MNQLEDIYHELRDLGVCSTQAQFSTDWLGRSSGYYAYVKSSGEAPDLASIGMLIGRLKEVAPTCDDSRYWDERRRIRTAIIAAKVMHQGEWELRHVPPWYRVTAI